MSTNTEAHEFEPITDPAFKNTTFAARCCKKIGGKYCGQTRTAAIHRLASDTPLRTFEHAIKEDYDTAEPAEAQDAPPERPQPTAAEVLGLLTVHLLQEHRDEAREIAKEIRIDYTAHPARPIAIDFVSAASTVNGLGEALRGAGREQWTWKGEKLMLCWCRAASCTDEPRCAAARAALARWEGKD